MNVWYTAIQYEFAYSSNDPNTQAAHLSWSTIMVGIANTMTHTLVMYLLVLPCAEADLDSADDNHGLRVKFKVQISSVGFYFSKATAYLLLIFSFVLFIIATTILGSEKVPGGAAAGVALNLIVGWALSPAFIMAINFHPFAASYIIYHKICEKLHQIANGGEWNPQTGELAVWEGEDRLVKVGEAGTVIDFSGDHGIYTRVRVKFQSGIYDFRKSELKHAVVLEIIKKVEPPKVKELKHLIDESQILGSHFDLSPNQLRIFKLTGAYLPNPKPMGDDDDVHFIMPYVGLKTPIGFLHVVILKFVEDSSQQGMGGAPGTGETDRKESDGRAVATPSGEIEAEAPSDQAAVAAPNGEIETETPEVKAALLLLHLLFTLFAASFSSPVSKKNQMQYLHFSHPSHSLISHRSRQQI